MSPVLAEGMFREPQEGCPIKQDGLNHDEGGEDLCFLEEISIVP